MQFGSWTRRLLWLAVLSQLSTTLVTPQDVKSSEEGIKLAKEVAPANPSAAAQKPTKPVLDGIGTKDAPVDGKDGRPHEGPFVETSAERDRKKAKENGEEIPDKDKAADRKKMKEENPKVPTTHGGVMDDPNRTGPKEGTRGTEGGISEKTKDGKEELLLDSEKRPDPPKEKPPSPHDSTIKDPSDKKLLGGLEKPDLSKKPHDIPPPLPPTVSKTDPLAILKPYTDAIPMLTSATSASIMQPLHSFLLSLTMIIFSEIGDKTFLVAALMAMKHPRLVVFSAAFTALIAMTILSAVLGHAFPLLVPKKLVNLAAAGLFMIFGVKLLREGYSIRPEQGVSEEMREVEMELEEKEHLARKDGRQTSAFVLEAGRGEARKRPPSPPESPIPSRHSTIRMSNGPFAGINNLFSLLLSPAWVQTFVMTFLGEWGDRSQIATIAMAAGQDYWWVTGGAVTGHGICTAIAVIGGRAIAGKVSLRMGKSGWNEMRLTAVTLGGGFAFLAFGIVYLFEAVYVHH